uniref:Uncharacterized protein n=1 Tax=Anguilla anguilla TaxID=7936 RepID=A0A0E9W0D3_ANGAN
MSLLFSAEGIPSMLEAPPFLSVVPRSLDFHNLRYRYQHGHLA